MRALAPGTSTAPTTRSAPITSCSIASSELITVWMRPCQTRSISRPVDVAIDDRHLRLHPAAICAAFAPPCRPEHDHPRRGDPRGAPISTPRPPCGRSSAVAPTCGAIRPAISTSAPATAAARRALDGLVGDGDHLPLCQEPRALVGGEVEVGEEHLSFAEPRVLLGLGFLDLHDHVGGVEHLVGAGRDRRTRRRRRRRRSRSPRRPRSRR